MNYASLPRAVRYVLFSFVLCIVLMSYGCVSSINANLPVYPNQSTDKPSAKLVIKNTLTPFSGERYLILEIDGFSPSDRLYVPRGDTIIDLLPGSHEIIHKMAKYKMYYFNPVTTQFNVEAGKTYVITFDWHRVSWTNFGYSIKYEGWTNEEAAKWPTENLIANKVF